MELELELEGMDEEEEEEEEDGREQHRRRGVALLLLILWKMRDAATEEERGSKVNVGSGCR